jgi:hypothetical protein
MTTTTTSTDGRTQPETALARGLIRQDKLHKLPESLRDLVSDLTPAGLADLRAVVSTHNHFDLLGLPVETRLTIYEYVLGTHNGKVKRDRRKAKQMPGLEVLCMSKGVSAEAYRIFTQINECSMRLALTARFDNQFKKAVSNFRLLNITVPTSWDITSGLGINAKRTASGKVDHILALIHQAYPWPSPYQPPIRLHINFEVQTNAEQQSNMDEPTLGLLHANQVFVSRGFSHNQAWETRAHAAFIQAQLGHMVEEARDDMPLRLKVSLTSNADRLIPGVEAKRGSETEVKVRIDGCRKQCVVKLRSLWFGSWPDVEEMAWNTQPL